jgi:hypothetical protein
VFRPRRPADGATNEAAFDGIHPPIPACAYASRYYCFRQLELSTTRD